MQPQQSGRPADRSLCLQPPRPDLGVTTCGWRAPIYVCWLCLSMFSTRLVCAALMPASIWPPAECSKSSSPQKFLQQSAGQYRVVYTRLPFRRAKQATFATQPCSLSAHLARPARLLAGLSACGQLKLCSLSWIRDESFLVGTGSYAGTGRVAATQQTVRSGSKNQVKLPHQSVHLAGHQSDQRSQEASPDSLETGGLLPEGNSGSQKKLI